MKPLLLVEDDPDDAALTRLGLERAGFVRPFALARDGVEALELLRRGLSPELILADLKMPRVDGLELARRVRREYGGVPVVIMSSSERDRDRRDALDAGAGLYFVKPILSAGYSELARALEGLLAARSR